MIVQKRSDYELHVVSTWIDPDTVRLQINRLSDVLQFSPVDLYLSPTELATLVDGINDVLCR